MSLVIVAQDMGNTDFEIDWLTVEKLNCSPNVREGDDAWGAGAEVHRTKIEPVTGVELGVNFDGSPLEAE